MSIALHEILGKPAENDILNLLYEMERRGIISHHFESYLGRTERVWTANKKSEDNEVLKGGSSTSVKGETKE